MKNRTLMACTLASVLNLVCALPAFATAVTADAGGLHIRSDDDSVAFNLGARVQFDGYVTHPDDNSKINSGVADNENGTYFRRIELKLSGKVNGYDFLIIDNLAASTVSSGLYEVFVAHDLGPGKLFVGQDKPWRSFDDMTSNADTLFLERNVLSDKGIYGGREFQQGLFYRILLRHPLFRHDHLFLGAAGYSLGNTVQSNSPQKGFGYNFRVAYAPLVEHHRWFHIGASYSSDHGGNGHPLRAYFKGYYGYQNDRQAVVDLTGNGNPRVNTEATELATAYGPFLLKGEYGWAQFRQNGEPKQRVQAYSVEGSVFLTGETRPYHIHTAAMSLPDPIHSYGAIELAAGYNHIRNTDFVTGDVGTCHRGDSAAYPHSRYNKCQVSNITAAVNYYRNPNVRFTLEYIHGYADLGTVDVLKDKPYTIEARAQFNWW